MVTREAQATLVSSGHGSCRRSRNRDCSGDPGRSGALANRIDDLLHRTCHLARALTGAEQAALKVDLDVDAATARKFFNLSERYEPWRDYRVDPRGFGLHGLAPGEVVRLTQDEVEAHPAWMPHARSWAALLARRVSRFNQRLSR